MKARSDPAARPPAIASRVQVGFEPSECALVNGAER